MGGNGFGKRKGSLMGRLDMYLHYHQINMKTKLFFLMLGFQLISSVLLSQYYYRTYGDFTDIPLSCGAKATLMSPAGQLMAGVQGPNLHVVRTNVGGVPSFNRYYSIPNSAGTPMNLTSVQITEANASTMVLIGSFEDAGVEGLFFLSLNPSGLLVNLRVYRWNLGIVAKLKVNGMHNFSGTRFYVTGSANATGGGAISGYPFAAEFLLTGINTWAYLYSPGSSAGFTIQGNDIERFNTTSGPQLFIVGAMTAFPGALSDAIAFTVDPATGTPISLVNRYGTNNTTDGFTGITTCNSTILGGVTGLMVSGSSDSRAVAPQNMDIWGVKLDEGLNVLGSNLYDYSPDANRFNTANDVVERFWPTSQYTYFFTGSVRGGSIGLGDINVIKTDASLTSVGNFTFGTATLDESGEMAQVRAGMGTQRGLLVFGSSSASSSNRDFIMAKSYFNGAISCSDSQATPNTFLGPGLLSSFQHGNFNSISGSPSPLMVFPTVPFATVCATSSSPGGSNFKTSENEEESWAELEDGNLVNIKYACCERNLSSISIQANEATRAEVLVTDMLGKVLFDGMQVLQPTPYTLPNLGELPPGIILVKVTHESGEVFIKKILFQ